MQVYVGSIDINSTVISCISRILPIPQEWLMPMGQSTHHSHTLWIHVNRQFWFTVGCATVQFGFRHFFDQLLFGQELRVGYCPGIIVVIFFINFNLPFVCDTHYQHSLEFELQYTLRIMISGSDFYGYILRYLYRHCDNLKQVALSKCDRCLDSPNEQFPYMFV